MEELGTNHIQFAAMGAMSYLKAKEKFNVTTIVQGINLQGQNKYRSFIVVKIDSSIKNLTDINGKRMAFGDKSSTQGHLIPRIMLSQQGLRLSDLAEYIYTGSHQHCAEVVLSGEYDVCGMQDTLAETMEKQGLLRILYRSPYFPGSGIVANDQVPTEVIKVVKQALLDFQPQGKDKDKLYHWDKLAKIVVQSLSDTLANNVLNGNYFVVSQLLERLQGYDENPIEYIYLTNIHHQILAHSYGKTIPKFIIKYLGSHKINTEKIVKTAQYHTERV